MSGLSESTHKRKIAIIGGTGDQGFGLSLRLAKAGEHVIIGSREKPKAEDAARRVKEILGEGCNFACLL